MSSRLAPVHLAVMLLIVGLQGHAAESERRPAKRTDKRAAAPQKGKRPDKKGLPNLRLKLKANSAVTSLSRLQTLVARIKREGLETLPNAAPVSIPSTPRPMAPTATPRSVGTYVAGLAAGGCQSPHYLCTPASGGGATDNRFDWWDKEAPPSGPIRQSFGCEFHPALATVVGANLNAIRARGYRTVPWDTATYVSANHVPGMMFAFRVDRNKSDPMILRRTVVTEDPSAPQRVLVNHSTPYPDTEIGLDEHRPSLWIDFTFPQRAVGLEYGYLPLPFGDFRIDTGKGVRLIAYDREGHPLQTETGDTLKSHGRYISTRSSLQPDMVNHRIGVMDKHGRISSVELRFRHYGGRRVLQSQVVYRIWHEPLAYAGVKQGSIAFESGNRPNGFPEFSGPLREQVLNLPFQCDHVMTCMRGFQIKFMDQRPHRVRHIEPRIDSPLVQQTRPGGTARLRVSGRLQFQGEPEPYRVVVYYTAVAWDSRLVEIHARASQTDDLSVSGQNANAVLQFPEPYPGPFTPSDASCGPLFGGLGWFYFKTPTNQDVDLLSLALGSSWSRQGHNGFLRTNQYGPNLALWALGSHFRPADGGYHWRVGGAALTGRSVVMGPHFRNNERRQDVSRTKAYFDGRPMRQVTAVQPPRTNPNDYFFDWRFWRDNGMAWPVNADVAFVALSLFHFRPEAPIRELDIEMHGARYDGEIVDWEVGGGVSIRPPIGNRRDGSSIYGLPAFGAIRRDPAIFRPSMQQQTLRFDAAIEGIQNRHPEQVGLVSNQGRGSYVIDRLTIDGPERNEFEFFFLWRGELRSTLGFNRWLPLQMRPGDTLLVTAHVTPRGPGGRNGTRPRVALLTFRSRDPRAPVVEVYAHANTAPIDPNAGGRWMPRRLIFGPVLPSNPITRSVRLVSTGTSPLYVDHLRIDDTSRGFSFEVPPNLTIPAAGYAAINVTFSPAFFLHPQNAKLIAATNAGNIELPLNGGERGAGLKSKKRAGRPRIE